MRASIWRGDVMPSSVVVETEQSFHVRPFYTRSCSGMPQEANETAGGVPGTNFARNVYT